MNVLDANIVDVMNLANLQESIELTVLLSLENGVQSTIQVWLQKNMEKNL
jgi:hypothetical protein